MAMETQIVVAKDKVADLMWKMLSQLSNSRSSWAAKEQPTCNDDVVAHNATSGNNSTFLRHLEVSCYFVISPMICVPGVLANIMVIIIMTRKRIASGICLLICGLAKFDALYLIASMTLFIMKTYCHHEEYSLKCLYYTALLGPLAFIPRMASTWTCVIISFERYIAVCHPLKAKSLCSVKVACKIIGCISLGSVVLLIPYWLRFDAKLQNNEPFMKFLSYYGLLLSALLPILFLVTFSGLSCHSLLNNRFHHVHGWKQGNRVTIVMLLMIACFLVLLSPTAILEAIKTTNWSGYLKNRDFMLAEAVSDLLLMLNSAINFLLYCVAGSRFRSAFVEWLQSCFPSNVPFIRGYKGLRLIRQKTETSTSQLRNNITDCEACSTQNR